MDYITVRKSGLLFDALAVFESTVARAIDDFVFLAASDQLTVGARYFPVDYLEVICRIPAYFEFVFCHRHCAWDFRSCISLENRQGCPRVLCGLLIELWDLCTGKRDLNIQSKVWTQLCASFDSLDRVRF